MSTPSQPLPPTMLEQAHKLAAEHPHDIVAVYSLDDKCRYASPSHLTILGYTNDEMLGHSWKRFVAPEDHAHAMLSGSATMLHGRSLDFGFRALTKYDQRVNMRGVAWIRVDPGTRMPFLVFHAHVQPESKGAFVIRGLSLGQTAADNDFAAFNAMLLGKGYHVYPSRILWDDRTVSQYADEFRDYYLANRAKYNLIIGGSIGAVTALKVAAGLRPNLLVLCSLSPLFAEDQRANGKQHAESIAGRVRAADLADVSAGKLAQAVSREKIPTIMTYGERELTERPELVKRVKATAEAIAGAQLHEIRGAGHRIRTPEYVAGLDKILS